LLKIATFVQNLPTPGVGGNRDFEHIASSRSVNAATANCYQHGATGPWQVVTLIAGFKRRSLLMAGDDDEMFMTKKFQRYPKDNRTTEPENRGPKR